MVNATGMNSAEAYPSWADLRDMLFNLVRGHCAPGHCCHRLPFGACAVGGSGAWGGRTARGVGEGCQVVVAGLGGQRLVANPLGGSQQEPSWGEQESSHELPMPGCCLPRMPQPGCVARFGAVRGAEAGEECRELGIGAGVRAGLAPGGRAHAVPVPCISAGSAPHCGSPAALPSPRPHSPSGLAAPQEAGWTLGTEDAAALP